MPTTDNLGITELLPGSSNKDVVVNSGFNWVDHVIAGILSKSVAGSADYTFTVSPDGGEAANAKITLTGARTGSGNMILPKLTRIWRIINNTTGAYTLTIKGSTGTGVAMVPGDDFFVRFDGTNFIKEYIAPFVLGVQGQGIPTPGIPILAHKFTMAVIFRAGLPNSEFEAGTAATGTSNFDIQKNGSSIGTMSFAASATVPTFTFASDVSFAIGDKLKIFPPGTADATLSDIFGAIRGER